MGCSSLSRVSLPKCSYIGTTVFWKCISLSQVNLPKCSYIDTAAFEYCTSLTQVNLPVCSYIGNNAFQSCSSLSQINLPKCSYIGSHTFEGCRLLSIITIGYSGVCSLSSSAFYGTKITSSTGSIYVPASLVNAYKSATNWSAYSNRIFAIR